MKRVLLILLLVVLLISGYFAIQYMGNISDSEKQPQQSSQSTSSASSTSSAEATVSSDPLKTQIDSMSLAEKVGQLVIAGLEGYEIDDNSKTLIEQYHVGGFILFKKNIKDSGQMLSLLNSLKGVNSVNKLPLFLSVDEEGGRISRLPDEFLKFPSNQKIGELNNAGLSNRVGSIIGQELKAFGFNVDFAPVLDINSNPKNPVIGDRSFGSNAEIVSRLGVQTMKGLQSENVIPVVKHFPGHGDTSVDSHVGLPVVNHDIERLKSFELVPFASAVENGADAFMIAHILLPKIDASNPASFSKKIISDVLRTDMKFDGVVITDDFTMGAIVKNYDIGEAAVKSIQAGSDIVLVCHGFGYQEAVIKALQNAANSGAISKDRIDRSVYRILKLKNKYNISDEPSAGINAETINTKIKELF